MIRFWRTIFYIGLIAIILYYYFTDIQKAMFWGILLTPATITYYIDMFRHENRN